MKAHIAVYASLFVVVVAVASFIPSRAQGAGSGPQQPPTGKGAPPANPLKVALLKWYQANQAPTRFDAGSEPVGLAFDGANIWVAAYSYQPSFTILSRVSESLS